AVRSADDQRRLQPSIVGVPGDGLAEIDGRSTAPRACVRSVRAAEVHVERWRPAVRLERARATVATGSLARASRCRPGADRARTPGPEWPARAIPRDLEGRDGIAAERIDP